MERVATSLEPDTQRPPKGRTFWRRRAPDLIALVGLALLISVIWCFIENRLSAANWRVPSSAASDSLVILAIEKAVSQGDYLLILQKLNRHLGAPYVANWNDFPGTEEPIVVIGGLLAKAVGLFKASNLLVLFAHLLAAVSFYVASRALACRREWACVASLAFGLSHFAFQRGLPHLGITYYWHIPLCLLVCLWCGSRGGLRLKGRKFWIALGIGLITGVHNVYYTNVFLQFLGFAAFAQTVRQQHWTKVIAPILIGTSSVAAALLMNLDTLSYQASHGLNLETARRSYQGAELYALKPIDLLIPPPDHRAALARKVAWNYVYDEAKKVFVRGELFSPYLGLFGIGALCWLGVVSLTRISSWPARPIPVEGAQSLWLILYSVIGGANGLMGQLGFSLFRCTNRYSIYILALVLLFAVKELSRLSRSWRPVIVVALATVFSALILWDQLPPRELQSSIDRLRTSISSDRAFTVELEKSLPPQAMVFQLPAMKFPESWPIVRMGDYQHFRPYLYSNTLHFSYGDDKGRGRDDWQFEVGRLPPSEMLTALEKYGFAAIYVDRNGYADKGQKLLDGLRAAGRSKVIESRARDLVAVLLSPSLSPILPGIPPQFKSGWYDEEGDAQGDTWHCSSGNSELALHNGEAKTQKVRFDLELASPSIRTVEIWVGPTMLYKSPALSGTRLPVSLVFELPPGVTKVSFKTEPPVIFPGNADTRLLSFVLYNARLIFVDD